MEQVCQLINVSRSGFYKWLKHKPSIRQQKNSELLQAIIELHKKYPALGLNSIYYMLKPEFHCSRKRVHRQMQIAHIHSIRYKAYKATTNSKHNYSISPNILQRNFCYNRINVAWVGDITYIPTDDGWLYLAIVKDLYDKKIVGYAFSERIDTNLTISALDMVVRRRKPKAGLIFHSDRGVQYASVKYRAKLQRYGIRQSMSRKGNPYDNAIAENFFSCLKCELTHLKHYRTRAEAQLDIFAYIEAFYNNIRPHSALGWISPNAFDDNLKNSNIA